MAAPLAPTGGGTKVFNEIEGRMKAATTHSGFKFLRSARSTESIGLSEAEAVFDAKDLRQA